MTIRRSIHASPSALLSCSKFYQAPLKERFPRSPFVQYTRGQTWGLVGFDKTLSEDELAYVKEHIKTLSGKDVTWSILDGESLFFQRV